jgi:mono/diheme cytochrome c family protein
MRTVKPTGAAPIYKLPYAEVLAVAQKEKGDVKLGRELYTRQGCVACHTISATRRRKAHCSATLRRKKCGPDLITQDTVLRFGTPSTRARGRETHAG